MPVAKAVCSKMSYENKQEALAEIKHQHSHSIRFNKRANKIKSGKVGKKMRTYNCPRCGKWHLTTQKQARKY